MCLCAHGKPAALPTVETPPLELAYEFLAARYVTLGKLARGSWPELVRLTGEDKPWEDQPDEWQAWLKSRVSQRERDRLETELARDDCPESTWWPVLWKLAKPHNVRANDLAVTVRGLRDRQFPVAPAILDALKLALLKLTAKLGRGEDVPEPTKYVLKILKGEAETYAVPHPAQAEMEFETV